MKIKTITAYIGWASETRLYGGSVPGIPGGHSQGASLDELQKNANQVLELRAEDLGDLSEELPRFAGLQQNEVSI